MQTRVSLSFLVVLFVAQVCLQARAHANNVYEPVSPQTADKRMNALVDEIRTHKAKGKTPIVVLDIDGTLLHGIYPRTTVATEAMEGAANYAHRLAKAGAKLIYLTARPDRHEKRTVKQLQKIGVPLGGEHELMIKPADEKDLAFKERAAKTINARGTMLALFDNELENLRAFRKNYPKTKAFRLATTTHADPSPKRGLEDITVLKNFAPLDKEAKQKWTHRLKRWWAYRPAKKISDAKARRLANPKARNKPIRGAIRR
jgi:hypothetical protein